MKIQKGVRIRIAIKIKYDIRTNEPMRSAVTGMATHKVELQVYATQSRTYRQRYDGDPREGGSMSVKSEGKVPA